jgi:hypothetical protein
MMFNVWAIGYWMISNAFPRNGYFVQFYLLANTTYIHKNLSDRVITKRYMMSRCNINNYE